jgi:hypothetical protein
LGTKSVDRFLLSLNYQVIFRGKIEGEKIRLQLLSCYSQNITYLVLFMIWFCNKNVKVCAVEFAKLTSYKGPFKYYVMKEVGGWGQKMAIFDDLRYCKSSKRWVGGPKKVENMMT